MTSFESKDIEGLVQCPKCKMYSTLGFCWNCEYDYENDCIKRAE